LIDPDLPPQDMLAPVEPLDCDMAGYADTWRSLAKNAGAGNGFNVEIPG
jgi:hypothetical protein